MAALGAEVGVALTREGPLRESLRCCAEALVRCLRGAFARIWTLDHETPDGHPVLELQASAGMYTHLDGPHSRIRLGELKIGRIARDCRPHLTNSVIGDPEVPHQEWALREGIVSFAGYPLVVDGRVVGVMAVFGRQLLTETALETMRSVSSEIALGIERRRAEGALRESEARNAAIIRGALDCIISIDHAGRIREFNPAAERIFGCRRAEVIGKDLAETIIPPSHRGRYGRSLGPHLITGESTFLDRRVEVTAMRADGSEFPAELAIVSTPAAGQPAFTGYLRDVTGARAAEQALRRSEEQLRQAQKMDAVGRLAGGVAHDFNNLLTVILGYADLMLADLPSDHLLRLEAEEIARAADQAAALTRQLLQFSRQQPLQPEVLDLNTVVSGIERMLRRLIGEDIELVPVLEPALGRVEADAGQMQQVLMNLAANARDAMPEGGRLTIETQDVELDEIYASQHLGVRPGRYVMLAVTDTGHGIDAETQSQLFEPFFTTKERGKGTGLGLAIVYGIVRQNGGHLWVYSEPGHGTTFKIYLPQVEAEPGAHRAGDSAPSVRAAGAGTVLVVEDEAMVRGMIRKYLAASGYEMLEAETGEEGLRICEQHPTPIHLLLTDVVMPGMDGRQLAERVIALRPETKVLFMSGYPEHAAVRHGVLERGSLFLPKPFTMDTLAGQVRAALQAE
jgi:two-component system, cell cycle sensor histidine kinase and response regulator CckA